MASIIKANVSLGSAISEFKGNNPDGTIALNQIQEALTCGHFETVVLENGFMLKNDEASLLQKPYNALASKLVHADVYGDVIICSTTEIVRYA